MRRVGALCAGFAALKKCIFGKQNVVVFECCVEVFCEFSRISLKIMFSISFEKFKRYAGKRIDRRRKRRNIFLKDTIVCQPRGSRDISNLLIEKTVFFFID